MTKAQLISELRDTEETLLIDLLGLTSTEIVDAFLDKVDEKLEYLYGQFEDIENNRAI